MGGKIKSLFGLGAAVVCIAIVVVLSCESRQQFTGTYLAKSNGSTRQAETALELKEDGQGVWKVGEDEVPFSWYVKDNQLRVNTKGGGVLVGSLDDGAIRLSFPGSQEISFKKTR